MHRSSITRMQTNLTSVAVPIAQLAGFRSMAEPLKRLPLVRNWRRQRHLAYFLSDEGFASHYGVFNSFSEARTSLPHSKEHDQSLLASEYVEVRSHRVYCYDYPVICWLNEALRSGARSIFDIGGSVGVHYRAYRKYLVYPPSMRWQVCEVPAIVELGRALADRAGETELTFTEVLDPDAVRADVWISAGAIHYIEDARPSSLLATCSHRPTHVLLNKLPLYDGEDFVSAQNMGPSTFVPHYVYNRERFIKDIESMGYRLVDTWEVPERHFYLPGHPEKSFGKYSGLYLRAE